MHNQSHHTIDTELMYRAQQLVAGGTFGGCTMFKVPPPWHLYSTATVREIK